MSSRGGRSVGDLPRTTNPRGLFHARSFLLIHVAMVIATYRHSVFHGFVGLSAAVHELSHAIAFRTRRLNKFFYPLLAFLTSTCFFGTGA